MRKSGESGFAMLLVFLMAAVIAISLYIQIPRVAFESQRQKEQLLMERGEQYKRAIQLFVRANGRYPGKIDDLENFNNRRFLRHKFKDPMTGKDEWRLIHINAAGVFTDSLTNKKKDDKSQSISTTGSIAEIPDLGLAAAQGQQTVTSAANRRRASEGGVATPVLGPDGQPVQPQNTGFPGAPGGQPFPGQPGGPQQSNQPYPANQPYPSNQPNQPGAAFPDQANPTGQPGYAFVNPNPQMGNQSPGAPVPPEVANSAGFATPQGSPGQPNQFRPPVYIPQPGSNFGNQSSGSSSIGGVSSIGGGSSSIGGVSSIGGGSSSIGGDSSLGSNSSSIGGPRIFNPVPPPTPAPPPPNPSDPGAFQTPGAAQNPAASFGQANGQPGNAATSMIQNMLTNPRQAPQGVGTGAGIGTPAGVGTSAGVGTPVGGGTGQPGGQQIGAGIAGVASTSESASIMIYNDHSNYNEWEFIFDYTKQRAAPNANAGVNGTPAQNMGSSPQGNATTPNAGIGNTSGFGNASPFGNTSGFGNPGFGNNPGAGQSASPQNQPPPTDLRLGQP